MAYKNNYYCRIVTYTNGGYLMFVTNTPALLINLAALSANAVQPRVVMWSKRGLINPCYRDHRVQLYPTVNGPVPLEPSESAEMSGERGRSLGEHRASSQPSLEAPQHCARRRSPKHRALSIRPFWIDDQLIVAPLSQWKTAVINPLNSLSPKFGMKET